MSKDKETYDREEYRKLRDGIPPGMVYAFHRALSDSDLGEDEFEEIRTGLTAAFAHLLSSAPAPVGVEPYGWHYWNIAGTSVLHLGRSNKLDADIATSKKHPDAHHVVPLYVTPQPTQPQAGAVPLTREQVKAICVEAGYDTAMLQDRADFINGIRHAERHHGIKGGEHAIALCPNYRY